MKDETAVEDKKKQSEIKIDENSKSQIGGQSRKGGKSPYEDVDQRFMQTKTINNENNNKENFLSRNNKNTLDSNEEFKVEKEDDMSLDDTILYPDSPSSLLALLTDAATQSQYSSYNQNSKYTTASDEIIPNMGQNQILSLKYSQGGLEQILSQKNVQGLSQKNVQGLGQSENSALLGYSNIDNDNDDKSGDQFLSFDDRPKKKPQPLSPENKNKVYVTLH